MYVLDFGFYLVFMFLYFDIFVFKRKFDAWLGADGNLFVILSTFSPILFIS